MVTKQYTCIWYSYINALFCYKGKFIRSNGGSLNYMNKHDNVSQHVKYISQETLKLYKHKSVIPINLVLIEM